MIVCVGQSRAIYLVRCDGLRQGQNRSATDGPPPRRAALQRFTPIPPSTFLFSPSFQRHLHSLSLSLFSWSACVVRGDGHVTKKRLVRRLHITSGSVSFVSAWLSSVVRLFASISHRERECVCLCELCVLSADAKASLLCSEERERRDGVRASKMVANDSWRTSCCGTRNTRRYMVMCYSS